MKMENLGPDQTSAKYFEKSRTDLDQDQKKIWKSQTKSDQMVPGRNIAWDIRHFCSFNRGSTDQNRLILGLDQNRKFWEIQDREIEIRNLDPGHFKQKI